MPTEYSWPRLRAILDQASASPRGIIVSYDSWVIAERVRANMYKIRDMQRKQARKTFPEPDDPRHGISAYDGLLFWLKSSIPRTNFVVKFHSDGEIETFAGELPETTRKLDEEAELFPGKCVTLSIETTKGHARVEFAPTYRDAWRILRQDFPCDLVIENGYDTSNLEIREI